MIDNPLNRLSVKRGEDLPQSKLSEAQVRKIRRDYARAKLLVQKINARYSQKGLARTYSCHKRNIEKIIAGEIWSHVD